MFRYCEIGFVRQIPTFNMTISMDHFNSVAAAAVVLLLVVVYVVLSYKQEDNLFISNKCLTLPVASAHLVVSIMSSRQLVGLINMV